MSILYSEANDKDIFLNEKDLEEACKLTRTITSHKIHAVLRKARFARAKWNKSRHTRGWGSWTEGYTIENDTITFIHLGYIHGSSISARKKSQEEIEALKLEVLKKYVEVLKNANISATIKKIGSVTKTYRIEIDKEQ